MKNLVLACLMVAAVFGSFSCSKTQTNSLALTGQEAKLYSADGIERKVSFDAVYKSDSSIEELKNESQDELAIELAPTLKYLFGPLVVQQIGAPQHGDKVTFDFNHATSEDGKTLLPYHYEGLWLLSNKYANESVLKDLPVPYNVQLLDTPNWTSCGDSEPEHQTWGFIWYFWLPSQSGCDHKLGVQYQNVDVQLGEQTQQTTLSYPEYSKMIRTVNGKKVLSMTFAFGYVNDSPQSNPFRDTDQGAQQFQSFLSRADAILGRGFRKTAIYQSEYGGDSTKIGTRYTGVKDGVTVSVSIVSNFGVDQMNLFAKSYAANHDSFFGWFGHSRVGSGFDAQNFRSMLREDPNTYSISPDYQLIYWAGCTSYSYYTQPFFDMKAALNPQFDPKGTLNLDIISNGMPAFFVDYPANAEILLRAVLGWNQPTSYQQIVQQLEGRAHQTGSPAFVNVLGDEDNSGTR